MKDLNSFLNPRSIAIVGASETAGKIGSRMVTTLRDCGYRGTLLPVNPGRATIHGYPAYAALRDLPQTPDLAVLCLPAEAIAAALLEGAEAGIRNFIIVSAGFAEAGAEGAMLQEEVLAIGRRFGLNISGPNSEGFYNVSQRIAATFSPAVFVDPGRQGPCRRIGVVAQSGGLGFSLFNRGRAEGLEFSSIISVGNQADLEVIDYAEALLDDPDTAVILIFIEGLKSPARFQTFAARAARLDKPVIVAKVGGSEAGKRAVASHTGSLSGSDDAYDAVFDRYGVLRAHSVEDMMAMAAAFTRYPLAQGNRVAVIASSGGAAAWLTDAAEAHGLTLPVIDPRRQARLSEFIPSFGATGNPVDLTAHGMRGITRSLEVLRDSPDIDALIVAGSFAHEGRLSLEGEQIRDIAQSCEKPVLLYTYSKTSEKAGEMLSAWDLHHFTAMDGVSRAVAAMAHRAAFRKRLAAEGLPVPPARYIADSRLPREPGGMICEYQVAPLLAEYGIRMAAGVLVQDAATALTAAEQLGWPVAIKIQSPQIPHKTEVDGVRLNIRDAAALRREVENLIAATRKAAPEAEIRGVLVQKMQPAGLELIAGVSCDSDFGPMVMCGLGGTAVEVLRDVAIAPAPLSQADALRMLDSLRAAPLLGGWRGAPALDRDAMADLLVRLSQFAHDHRDRIAEIDLNPVFLYEAGHGYAIVDALMILQEGRDNG